jgi:hypothetical protein
LGKTGRGIVVRQTGERLDRIEIKSLFFDNLLKSKIKADGSLVDDIFLGCSPKEFFQTGLKVGDFLGRNFFGSVDEFAGIARVDVHAKHSHPLGRIGDSAGLTHAAAAEGSHGRHVQGILKMSGSRVADDLTNRFRVAGFTIDKLVGNANFQQTAMHDESADGPPALRARMRPEQHGFAAGRVIANGSDQMRGPDPGAGEKDDHVDMLVGLHPPEGSAGFVFRGYYDLVFHNF